LEKECNQELCQDIYRQKEFWHHRCRVYKYQLKKLQAAILWLDNYNPEDVAAMEAKFNFDARNLVEYKDE